MAGDHLCGPARHAADGAPGAGAQPHRPQARVLAMTMPMTMTPTEVREIAQATGREVVRETLLAIGLDVADPVKLQRDFVIMREVGALAMDPEFRKDIEHTRKWRKAIEQVETKGFIAAVGMIATGVIGLIWAMIKGKVGQ